MHGNNRVVEIPPPNRVNKPKIRAPVDPTVRAEQVINEAVGRPLSRLCGDNLCSERERLLKGRLTQNLEEASVLNPPSVRG